MVPAVSVGKEQYNTAFADIVTHGVPADQFGASPARRTCSRRRKRTLLGRFLTRNCVPPRIKFPAVIDTIDSVTERPYAGWPDRRYVIDQNERVSYKSDPEPFGFSSERRWRNSAKTSS